MFEDLLMEGLTQVVNRSPEWDKLNAHYTGTHERPFAPVGVNTEYRELQEMAVAPWLRLVVKAPVQRLRVDGFRTGSRADTDDEFWANVWTRNSLSARQGLVYTDGMVQGRGIIGVWPGRDQRFPVVAPESPRNVYVHADPNNPSESLWAVKAWNVSDDRKNRALDRDRAAVYTRDSVQLFAREKGQWAPTSEVFRNPLGAVPFVEFAPEVDSSGHCHSMIEPLIPMQRAIDTARFDLLLALQFSAARQRAVTGFDPVMRDGDGNVIFKTHADGSPVLDAQGQPVPATMAPGRPGVDRLLVFPGADTKVWDLPESNMSNYVQVISMLVQHLAAISQVPPQYLLGGMANLSGDALTAAESTLASMVADLQLAFASSWAQVAVLAGRAMGRDEGDTPTDVVWGDGQARSFGATVDGITKLIASGFPLQGALEMLPGATDQKVRRWMELAEQEADDPVLSRILGKDVTDDGDPAGRGAAVPGAAAADGGDGPSGGPPVA